MATESLAGDLDRVLFLLFNAGSNHFHHLALVRGKAADFTDNSAHGSDTLVESSLAVGLSDLLGIGVALGLGDDEPVVEANGNTTLLQLLYHLET